MSRITSVDGSVVRGVDDVDASGGDVDTLQRGGSPGAVVKAAGLRGSPAGDNLSLDKAQPSTRALLVARLAGPLGLGLLSTVLNGITQPGFVLDRVSLSAPPGVDVLRAGSELVRTLTDARQGGAWLVLDVKGGRQHWYGYVLGRDTQGFVDVWERLTGCAARANARARVVDISRYRRGDRTGGTDFDLLKTLTYALKPWPPGDGERDLDRHILACGGLAGFSKRLVAALHDGVSEYLPLLCKASPEAADASTCRRCGRPLPPGKRRDAKHCSKACRQARWVGERRRIARLPPKEPQPAESDAPVPHADGFWIFCAENGIGPSEWRIELGLPMT